MYELSGQAEGVDWTDVAMAGRAYADNVVGEPAITAAMHRMADEIERLRLTEPEREAVETSFDALQYAADELGLGQGDCDRLAATLRGLLERTSDRT
jgi:hypothetical protein